MADDDAIRWHRLTAEELRRLKEAAPRVLAGHPWVKAAYLYGSAVGGERPARDLDVGLLADPVPTSFAAEAAIAAALREATGIDAVDFDVRVINQGSPVFLNEVLRAGVLLYEADHAARVAFEVRAMSLWLEFRPVYERLCAAALARWSHE
jgi:predicted nucleotidyltransferase